MQKVIVVPVVIGALGAVSMTFKKYMWRESEFGSHPENSIAGDSKDTNRCTVPGRRKKRGTCHPW